MSTSATRTVSRKDEASDPVNRQRPYDHLYDPIHILSSETDFAKANFKARTSRGRIRKVFDFTTMFSDNPGFTIKLDPTEPVPAYGYHHWRAHQQQNQHSLHLLAGVFPNAESWMGKDDHKLTGTDFWKYYKRPLIPVGLQFSQDLLFAFSKEDFITAGKKDAEKQSHRTIGVQTDYRESEAQTDPYSPDYVVQPGTSPSELLQLATLTFGHGLPAGLAEVEMIERARAKRIWEASLPPTSDLSQVDKRRRMMRAMEAEDWAFREGEIQKLHDVRLDVLKELLIQRDEAQKDFTNHRMHLTYLKLLKDKETKQEKINNDYMRALRKLEAKRKNARRSFGQITNSEPFVSRIRMDVPKTRKKTNSFEKHYFETYQGLLELEAGLKATVFKPAVKKRKPKFRKSPFESTEAMQLLKKYTNLREQEKIKKEEEALRFLLENQKLAPRPLTPTVVEPTEGEEEIELAVITLQKLLRGRSIQNEMFRGKENNWFLIHEQRTVHALQFPEQQIKQAEKELVTTLKKQRDEEDLKLAKEEAAQARFVGTELEEVFETLNKELIRLQQERNTHAFALLAERDRRLREAEESGRRQMEERRRQEEDKIFRQVVKVNQETVDLYLEDVILKTIGKMSDQLAREEIRRRAKEITDIAYAMEESRTKVQSEEIVSEFVYSFLIPEVEKINFRHKVRHKQLPHLMAAQAVIHDAAEDSGIPSGTLQDPPPPSP